MFKVIPEGKVPEHFEKGMVSCCIAYIFQIIMLPARPQAFLAGYGAFVCSDVLSEEDGLKLDHPGIGKKQGRVIAWYQ